MMYFIEFESDFFNSQRLNTKLSDMREKVKDGKVPLPLMTCVNVKADRSARSFQGTKF